MLVYVYVVSDEEVAGLFLQPSDFAWHVCEVQPSLALVFCITVKSCCLFVCLLLFCFFFFFSLLLKTALSRDSCTFSLISVIAVHFRKQIAEEVDCTRNKVQFEIKNYIAFCIIRTRMRASESPPGLQTQSRTQSLLVSYCACSTKTKDSGKNRFVKVHYFANCHCGVSMRLYIHFRIALCTTKLMMHSFYMYLQTMILFIK